MHTSLIRSTRKSAPQASRGVVLQSYKKGVIPNWMSCCQTSVREWARLNNMAYLFIGDELFEDVPSWVAQRVHSQKLLLSDWGRLCWLRRLLRAGANTVVWVDMDVLIFDNRLQVTSDVSFRACAEWWIQRSPRGNISVKRAINNSVLTTRADGLPIIDFLLRSAAARLRLAEGSPEPRLIGTTLLTELARTWHLPVRHDVLTSSPHLLLDIVAGHGPLLTRLRQLEPQAPRAANLCASFVGRKFLGVDVTDSLMMAAVECLPAMVTG